MVGLSLVWPFKRSGKVFNATYDFKIGYVSCQCVWSAIAKNGIYALTAVSFCSCISLLFPCPSVLYPVAMTTPLHYNMTYLFVLCFLRVSPPPWSQGLERTTRIPLE